MSMIRIISHLYDDANVLHSTDKKERLIFDVILNDQKKITPKLMFFGVMETVSEDTSYYEKYPFIFKAEEHPRNPLMSGKITYGDWDADDSMFTSLPSKVIAAGETFSVLHGGKDYLYIINTICDWQTNIANNLR